MINNYEIVPTEYFINLTNGLEILERYFVNFQFIRLQSTQLEQGRFQTVLENLDNNFLMKLAIGRKCVVIDFGSRGHKRSKNGDSRACWQGLAWIEYCLNRSWFNRHIKCDWGMHHHFEEQYKTLTIPVRKKLKYFRKFLMIDKVHIYSMCEKTTHDSDVDYYRKIVEKYLKP